ncbi:MAG: GumC family protein, partial [Saprospiraceae bacterium]
MNIRKEFQKIILPLLKAAPILIALCAITVFFAKKGIGYLPHEYQSKGAIKINNLNSSQTGFDLFQQKNNNTPMQNENFLTEIEVFKSKDLIESTLKQLDWELTIHRVGEMRMMELYEQRPFQLAYEIKDASAYDRDFYLKYGGENIFYWVEDLTQDSQFVAISVDTWQEKEKVKFKLTIDKDFVKGHPTSLKKGDLFKFTINSMEALVSSINDKNLFVRPVEKDISIIRIYFTHELPNKAQRFVNTLMDSYQEECRLYKEKMSDETLTYMDKRLAEVGTKLRTSESEMAYFRTKNNLVNTRQETDAILKEIKALDMQNLDFDMQKVALEKLYRHLTSGKSLNDYAPNFKALQDNIFQQSYMKVQAFELEKQDLLQKFVPESTEISLVDAKIKNLRVFINETVRSTLENLEVRQKEIANSITTSNGIINAYPEKERQLVVLERAVSLNENMYNYLMQKRTELAISRSSNLYPHKVIEKANFPKDLVSPNQPLIIGLCVFLVLTVGIICVFIYNYFTAKIKTKEDIETEFETPVIGRVWKNKKQKFQSFEVVSDLMANISKLPVSAIEGQGKLLVVSSMQSGEGKSFTCINLAKTLAATGQRVLLIDMDIRRPSLHKEWGLPLGDGVSAILEGRKHT